ncbi:hypothetical protein PR048_027119 [Dryococelus australis]|uniref:Carboxylesterase type B domain-containing protein n=1 Tax=Dryococelus australis TaxID=614101 RepID=A0ABQ9GEJ3_9NEOP|nr:hypothetical protein PR048_027119 [Dryococelus australis]
MYEWLSFSDRQRAASEVTSGRELCDCQYQSVNSAAGRLDITNDGDRQTKRFLNANVSPRTKARVANYGLMDQIAALHWVQQNIALFSGDPGNVTLMGHGTGAACINFLITSPTVMPGDFNRSSKAYAVVHARAQGRRLPVGVVRGIDKGDKAMLIKCTIAPTCKALNCSAELSPGCPRGEVARALWQRGRLMKAWEGYRLFTMK